MEDDSSLRRARRRVIDAQARIQVQQAVLADFRAQGFDTSSAERTLERLQEELAVARAELARQGDEGASR